MAPVLFLKIVPSELYDSWKAGNRLRKEDTAPPV